MTETIQFGLGADVESLVAAGVPVTSPALVPNPVNLVRSSRTNTDNPSHWEVGFSYLSEGAGEIGVDDMCSRQHDALPETAKHTSDWTPYFLTAKYYCSTIGYDVNDYAGRAQRLLEAATPKLLEWEFWGGTLAQSASLNNSYLADGTGPAAVAVTSMGAAIGSLENALGKCGIGARGMIHCPPYAVGFFGSNLRREGNLLLTDRDTIVVPGSGYAQFYSGTGAFDMYATGLTDVRLGPVYVEDNVGIDKTTNTITIRAYRAACVSWDELCKAKVTVTLP